MVTHSVGVLMIVVLLEIVVVLEVIVMAVKSGRAVFVQVDSTHV
jgi:hypothetical protein